MKTLLNIIWFVFGGLWLALSYWALGLLMCLTVVLIPWGIASFRIGSFALWPFGRTIVNRRPVMGPFSVIGNVIWILVAGVPIVIAHVTTAAAQAVTIVGIPLALANIKLIPVSLMPIGTVIVPARAGAWL
ncbi:YccF domain-containing protein [Falsarthrobacter nasiphocae]|uniref:Uncharacterized membrane protein YccF (DUF307 family) n=1 Tax=Falsarthrobacter nasiphocae TaxID=189863 RepID=A0AAE4C6M2_9MICC|nr:YccF domain-containing protein [Falsarthrobacter nasiphocae]MDR6892312.1 uncharacterized membrane protein YccF (DUF307 family) [Falsarthrobacter nasiphocae]